MSGSSTIPAAIDALVAAVTAAAGGTQVVDGPLVGIAPHEDHIIIGGSLDELAVEGSQEQAAFGRPRREEYELVVECGAYSGGGTQKEVRDRAYALVAVVEGVISADRKLGGAVKATQAGSRVTTDQRPPTEVNDAGEETVLGRKCVVSFRVACLGWIE